MAGAGAGGRSEPELSRRSHWANYVQRHAHEQADRVALRFNGRSTTWQMLNERVGSIANAFYRRGVRSGDRVLMLMTNRPECVEVMVAAHRLGAIAVPINFRLSAAEVGYIAADAGGRLMVVDEGLLSTADAACAGELASITRLVATDSDTGRPPAGVTTLAEAMDEPGEDHPPCDVDENSAAVILYTSGTTGRPKGAVLSHLNLFSQSVSHIRTTRIFSDEEVSLTAAPMFHIAALGALGPMLLIGGTSVILPTGAFSAAALLDCLESERVSSVFLVPTQWQAVCAEPGVTDRKLALRSISWGAAPASETLLRRMAEVFPNAQNVAVFGQTEMSPVTCAMDAVDALRKVGSVGKPISAVQVRIVDDQLRDVGVGEVGEIVYRGPGLMTGYWRNPAATAEAFEGGWFHSGDLVRRDDEGYIYVVDRKKDMLISGGENIYSAEVENALAAHPDIAEVAVVGRADERWGEIPVAVIVARSGRVPTVAELEDWCGDRLARYKRPKAVLGVAELPHNASGKVLKGPLRELVAQQVAG